MANYTQNYITAEEFTTLQNHGKMYQGFIKGVGYAYIDYFVIAPVHLYGNGSPYVEPGMDMFIQGIAQNIDTSEEAVAMSYGDEKVVKGASSSEGGLLERAEDIVYDEMKSYTESTIDGMTYAVSGLGSALYGGFRAMYRDFKYNGGYAGYGYWYPDKSDPNYALGFSFDNKYWFKAEPIQNYSISWNNGKRVMNGTIGILLIPVSIFKTGYKVLDILIDQLITNGVSYGVGKGIDSLPYE